MTASLLKFNTTMPMAENENPQQNLAEALAQYRELLNKGEQATPEEKETLFENFNEEILKDAHQRYNSLSDEQKKQYATLTSIWRCNAHENNMQIQDKDGQLVLRCKNNETNLEMAIMSDSVSLVFAQDKQLENAQLQSLHNIMDNAGLQVTQFPEDVTVKTNDGSVKNIREAWNNETAQEAANETVGAHDEEITLPNDWESYDYEKLEELLQNTNSAIALGGGNKNQGLLAMRNKIRARMGSMGYSGRVVTDPIRNGWSLTATNKDPKTGKSKKAFEIKVKMKKGVPSATYRMWNGEKFDNKIAVMCLDALKVGGADYFTLPPAVEIGGSEYVAFMEAAGKTLMLPICKSAESPDAIELDADAVKKIIEAAEKNNTDSGKLADFKERLYGVLREQETYKAAQAQKKGSNYTTNSVLQTEMTKLSASRVSRFNETYLSQLEKGIRARATAAATGQPNGWDFLETQAALRAATDIANFVTEHENFYYNSSMKPVLDRMFQTKMQDHKDQIAKQLEGISSRDEKETKKEIRAATEALVGETLRTTEENYSVKLSLGRDIAKISTKYDDKNKKTKIPYDFDSKKPSNLIPLPPRTQGTAGRPIRSSGYSY